MPSPFRIFRSPYTFSFHQDLTYLRLKGVHPVKLHCSNYVSSVLCAAYYQSAIPGTLTPCGNTYLHIWDLMHAVEARDAHARWEYEQLVAAHQRSVAQKVAWGTQEHQPTQPVNEGLSTASPIAPHPTPSSMPPLHPDKKQNHNEKGSSFNTARKQFDYAALFSELPPPPSSPSLDIDPKTHSRLHVANWAFSLYSYWWLGKTAMMYRYVLNDDPEVIGRMLYYFCMIPGSGQTLSRWIAPYALKGMRAHVAMTGICEGSAVYMKEHFELLVRLLEAHFEALAEEDASIAENEALERELDRRRELRMREKKGGGVPIQEPEEGNIEIHSRFLLGTPHPTMADVLLASFFSGCFLMDSITSSLIIDRCPCLLHYVERVTGWSGKWLPTSDPPETPNAFHQHDYPDILPPTLLPILELIEETLPFLLSQVASLRAFTLSHRDVDRLRIHCVEGGDWKGCTGRVLPFVTPIESLMIIDTNILTTKARSFDLEFALRAGEALSRHSTTQERASDTSAANAVAMEGGSHCVFSSTGAEVLEEAAEEAPETSVIDPEDADFYRGYTNSMRRRLKAVELYAARHAASHSLTSPVLTQTDRGELRAVIGESGEEALHSSDPNAVIPRMAPRSDRSRDHARLAIVLKRVEKMIQSMHMPNFTIATVRHRRRHLSLLIPEHEAYKVRARLAQEAQQKREEFLARQKAVEEIKKKIQEK